MKNFFNRQLGENEDEIGLLYDILRYNSNLLKAVKRRNRSVMEIIYRNVWNSKNGINYMKKMNYVINVFKELEWIRKITNDEWTLISKNIDEIEIDKYNEKDFIELIKSLGHNKKSIIPKPKYDGIGLEATSNKTSYESIISNPMENDKYESPKPMENNIKYFIERIREFDKSFDKYPNNQAINEMDKFRELYRNIEWNKKVEDSVTQILRSEIGLYGINNKMVVSYVDVLNETFNSIRAVYESLEKASESSILESIEYNLALHKHSSLRLW